MNVWPIMVTQKEKAGIVSFWKHELLSYDMFTSTTTKCKRYCQWSMPYIWRDKGFFDHYKMPTILLMKRAIQLEGQGVQQGLDVAGHVKLDDGSGSLPHSNTFPATSRCRWFFGNFFIQLTQVQVHPGTQEAFREHLRHAMAAWKGCGRNFENGFVDGH